MANHKLIEDDIMLIINHYEFLIFIASRFHAFNRRIEAICLIIVGVLLAEGINCGLG